MPKSASKPLLHYFENWWKVEDDFIWYLAGGCESEPDLKAGAWYFSDEADGLHGPYDSRLKAEAAFAEYIKCL